MKWYYIVAIIVLMLVVAFVIIRLKKVKNKKSIQGEGYANILYALGGKENVTAVSVRSSRISVSVKDSNIVNTDKLTEYGVELVVKMLRKVTLVVNSKKAGDICNYLSSCLENN